MKCRRSNLEKEKQTSKTSMNAGRLNWAIGFSRFTSTHQNYDTSTLLKSETVSNTLRFYAVFSAIAAVILILLLKSGAGYAILIGAYLSLLVLPFLAMCLAPWMNQFAPGPEEEEEERLARQAGGEVVQP